MMTLDRHLHLQAEGEVDPGPVSRLYLDSNNRDILYSVRSVGRMAPA